MPRTPPEKYRFKKGHAPPPGGTGPKKVPPALKALKLLTNEELIEVANLVVRGKADVLVRIACDPNATSLEKMIASVVSEIIATGNMPYLDKLLDRILGKVPDKIDLDGGRITVQVNLPSNGREVK